METIKKNQSEMKDTVIERKNNLQKINSTVDEAKTQVSNLEYKEAKSTPIRTTKESHKMRIVYGASGTTLSIPTFAAWRCQRRQEKIENLSEKNNDKNFPNPVKEVDIRGLSGRYPAM